MNELARQSKLILKLLLVIVLIVGAIAAAQFFNLQELLQGLLDQIAGLGPWGPVTFIFTYIVATVLFIPGSALTLGAGLLFGVFWGSVYVSIGATSGAVGAFLVGRYLVRGWVEQRLEANDRFKAINEAVARQGWKIVALTRLSPVFPFNLLNYAFGVTQVSFKDYFLLTWLGIMPGTVVYVYLGSLAGSLTMLGREGQTRTPAEWAFYTVGLAATVVVTVYVARVARQALENRMTSSPPRGEI